MYVPLFTHAMESLGLLCVGVRVFTAATLPLQRGLSSSDALIHARTEKREIKATRGRLEEQGKGVFIVL